MARSSTAMNCSMASSSSASKEGDSDVTIFIDGNKQRFDIGVTRFSNGHCKVRKRRLVI